MNRDTAPSPAVAGEGRGGGKARTLIRPAHDTDADIVAALINAINSLGDDVPDPPMTADIVRRDLLGAQPKAILFVTEWRGRVVGFATVGLIYDAVRVAWAMMLLDLYVAPEARRRGLARGLMARLAAEARARDARCLWWGVDEGDDEAILFYRAIGARSEGMFSGEIIEGEALDRLARGLGLMAATVRPLAAADLEAVAAMVFALNEAEGYDPALSPNPAALRSAYLGASATGRCLVAESPGIVGYVTLHTTYETTYASRGAYLGDLFVLPAYRRGGIGRALVAAAVRIIREAGGAHLWWTALPHNVAGQAFYARLGAKPEAVIAYALSEAAFDRMAGELP